MIFYVFVYKFHNFFCSEVGEHLYLQPFYKLRMVNTLKAILIFPPFGDITQPPLGISQIAGFVRSRNQTVKLYDFNIDCIEYFLNAENLRKSYETISNRIRNLEQKNNLTEEELEEYKTIFKSYLNGKYLIENIETALNAVRSIKIYNDWSIYSKYTSIIERSMELVADCYYPTKWNFRSIIFSGSCYNSQNIKDKIENKKENFLIPYFTYKAKEILNNNSDINVIGISINYASQLIPGLTLANIIKKNIKNSRIVVGGSFFSNYIDRWNVFDEFASLIDIIIPYSGEEPWYNIVHSLEHGQTIINIPNSVVNINGTFKYIGPDTGKEVIRTLPDFSDFELNRYLIPRTVLPYSFFYGCYWEKCNFCTYQSYKIKNNIKRKNNSTHEIVKDLCILNKRYGVSDFYFVDEAIPPVVAKNLSKEIISKNLPFNWFGEMRFDSCLCNEFLSLIKHGGCSLILFGMESAVDRVLKKMNKGTNVRTISKILHYCSKNGIKSFIMFFIGFPTETLTEALKTIKFIEKHKEEIQYIGFDKFILYKNIDVYQNPDKYGIKLRHNEDDLCIYENYSTNEGLSEHEVKDFVEKVKQRPIIKNYLMPVVISRNHLTFLPNKILKHKNPYEKFFCQQNFKFTPILNKNIVFAKSQIDIIDSVHKGCYYYLYNPLTQDICEIGYSGSVLLKYCTGSNTLNDILAGLNDKERQKLLSLYKILFDKGMLTWREITSKDLVI